MRAARHVLRFVSGVSYTAATYGSGNYGTQTYGQEASDPVASLQYRLIPWPGGYPTDPAWIYRQGDVAPRLRAQIRSDDGPLDLTGVDVALLVLTPNDGRDAFDRIFDLTVVTTTSGYWLERDWEPTDLIVAGNYRAAAVIEYQSGRRLTVPNDDRQNFIITPGDSDLLPTPGFDWDDPTAVWDGATWQ